METLWWFAFALSHTGSLHTVSPLPLNLPSPKLDRVMSINKSDSVVGYEKGILHKITWPFDHVDTEGHATNDKQFISTVMTSTATKLDRMVTYGEKSLSIKCDTLKTWSQEVVWKMKVISGLSLRKTIDGLLSTKSHETNQLLQDLSSQNMAWWWLILQSHDLQVDFPFISRNTTLLSSALVRSREKWKTIYLHLQKASGKQFWKTDVRNS